MNPIISKTIDFVKQELKDQEASHDWYHVERVWKLSKKINQKEKGDTLIVELSALLHDIADFKFHNGDEELGPKKAEEFLKTLNLDSETIKHITNIVRHISFKGLNHKSPFSSKELYIVQDADRLDAIGAIGIARAFMYAGYKHNPLYIPALKPNPNMSKQEYIKNKSPAINHFYEKLLHLKDLMNTKTGKQIAEKRHEFMKLYLNQFFKEWNQES